MNALDANKRQLEIWKKTLDYEIAMMAPQSKPACDDFLDRLRQFEKELEQHTQHTSMLMLGTQRTQTSQL
ncbi:hypothetical protein J31TS6_57800 [Brevibacillus reuszeri]|uniref:hypothetical protein n=1 Tax=Brevibacillus reuszeri TaxID=54915 RepID=UPI001B16DF3F|nr:hypothetical protein [Brevibacillus reuszeri]GIO09752.1 hypothetical protein J31TS6_57800 [Brevibacillus reuszeri]